MFLFLKLCALSEAWGCPGTGDTEDLKQHNPGNSVEVKEETFNLHIFPCKVQVFYICYWETRRKTPVR